tara:strand:- start:460 stop:825 length:366 start_codon:yes stop_codon:yes gene_type:complete
MILPQKFLIIIRQAPFSSELPAAALDIMLTAAAFEQKVTLLFSGDGVQHLIPDQNAKGTGMKSISQALPVLELYDIKKILADHEALLNRNLHPQNLLLNAEPVSMAEIAAACENADQVFNF